jgi:hypothetical protein
VVVVVVVLDNALAAEVAMEALEDDWDSGRCSELSVSATTAFTVSGKQQRSAEHLEVTSCATNDLGFSIKGVGSNTKDQSFELGVSNAFCSAISSSSESSSRCKAESLLLHSLLLFIEKTGSILLTPLLETSLTSEHTRYRLYKSAENDTKRSEG